MSEKPKAKKRESELTHEQLENATGGATKSGDVTLKRGTFATADGPDRAKWEDIVDSTVAHDDWKMDDAS